jgi:hypothetical protein
MEENEVRIKDNIKLLWWIPCTLISLMFNWIFFVYAGFASKNKKLIYFAFLYAVPYIMILVDLGNIAFKIWYIFWIAGFIHAVSLRKQYVEKRLAVINNNGYTI